MSALMLTHMTPGGIHPSWRDSLSKSGLCGVVESHSASNGPVALSFKEGSLCPAKGFVDGYLGPGVSMMCHLVSKSYT